MRGSVPALTPLRESLVSTAIGLGDNRWKALAIAGLGAGLAHLTEPLRARLVSIATGLDSEWHRAEAVAGLCAGMASLSERQRESVISASTGLLGCQFGSQSPNLELGELFAKRTAGVIARLGGALACLNTAQRERIVSAAIGFANSDDKCRAISGLADRVLLQRAEGTPLGPLMQSEAA
jgi:hypothetical protein